MSFPSAAILKGNRLPWIAAALVILGFLAASWIAYRATRPAELKPLVRLDVDLGSDVSLNLTSGVAAVLTRMQRPPTTHVDVRLAREMAEREGIKAIIDGSITPVGATS